MKNKITAHFQYNWWIYIVVVVVVVVFWLLFYNGVFAPDKNEQIIIDFYGADLKFMEMESHLANNLAKYTEQSIKKITVNSFGGQDILVYQQVTASVIASDLLIFEKSMVDIDGNVQINVKNGFEPFDKEKLCRFLEISQDNLKFYELDGLTYGVYLTNDDEVVSTFENFYNGDEDCIVMFSPNSQNLSTLYSDDAIPTDCAALDLLSYLLT